MRWKNIAVILGALGILCSLNLGFFIASKQDVRMAYEKGRMAGIQDAYENAQRVYKQTIVQEITYCESRDIHNRTSNKGAYGRAQFMNYTFNWMKNLANMPNLQWRNEQDQMLLLNWAIENGYGKHWQYCYKRAKRIATEQILIQYAGI